MRMTMRWPAIALAGMVFAAPATAQPADEVASFFRGRTITAITGFQAGSSSDAYLRTFARHVVRHLPGQPGIVVQNMPGAGSLIAVQHLANIAPRDGTVFALYNPGILIEPLLNPTATKIDPRTFGWIGSLADEQTMCGFWAKDINTLADLRKREIALGATGGTAGSSVEGRLIMRMLGVRFRMVEGYRGLAEVRLAAERGEVDGHCSLYMSILKSEQEDAWKSGRIKIPIQVGIANHPELPNVPNLFDLVDEPSKRILQLLSTQWTIARPLSLPPGVPQPRIAAWRAAFHATMADPEFLADAAKAKLWINPLAAEKIEPILAATMQTPEAVLTATREILKGP
jgi:tripartite-type tricarboxylate transporter receptor subunit TctC